MTDGNNSRKNTKLLEIKVEL